MFHVVRSTSKFLYLASPSQETQIFKPKQEKVKFLPGVLSSCKSLLKRKFFGDKDDLVENQATSSKRTKISHDPEEALQLALINPQECVVLINHHASQVLELKDEFLEQKNVTKIAEGVSKSRSLKLGNLNTVFIQLEPKSSTEYSNCNFNLNFILHEGESVLLKTMTSTEDEFHENDPTVETEPFKLPEGSYYSLENNHQNERLLLRVFWAEAEN